MKILLNVIGILIFFINRFANRSKKTVAFSFKFWIRDNWEQSATILLFDIALMILLSKEGLNIDFTQLAFLPPWLQLIGDLAASFIIGLLGAWIIYCGYKKIVINKRVAQ